MSNKMTGELAVKHLYMVRHRAEDRIKWAKESPMAINIKPSLDDIAVIDFAISAIEKIEKVKFLLNTPVVVVSGFHQMTDTMIRINGILEE